LNHDWIAKQILNEEMSRFIAENEALGTLVERTGICVSVLTAAGEACYATGLADGKRQIPMCSDTRFPIASLTKAFTAAACSILVDDNRLDISAPINATTVMLPLKDPLTSRR
jgi:CubicO group peptidase (beta-lactamase class C family)